jgi:hypothetical protein
LGIGCQYYGYPVDEKPFGDGYRAGGGALTEISA